MLTSGPMPDAPPSRALGQLSTVPNRQILKDGELKMGHSASIRTSRYLTEIAKQKCFIVRHSA